MLQEGYMAMEDMPVVVQAALGAGSQDATGRAGGRDQPDSLYREALTAWDAGAAVVRLRSAPCRAIGAPARRRLPAIVEGLRARGCDAIASLALHAGVDPTVAERSGEASLRAFDMVSLDCASARGGVDGAVPERLRRLARWATGAGVPVELRCAGADELRAALALREEGLVPEPLRVQLTVDSGERGWTVVERMTQMRSLLPPDAVWTAAGTGLRQLSANVLALLVGGHLATGLEDNRLLVQDVAATNRELVERVVRIVDDLDRPLATPDEAREVLGLPTSGRRVDRRAADGVAASRRQPVDLQLASG